MKTKDIIIKESIKLFYRNGYSKTSVRDIVKAARITNSSLYNHFTSKEEILYTIIQRIGDDILGVLTPIVNSDNHPQDKLSQMIFQMIVNFKDRKKEVKIYLDEAGNLNSKLSEKIRRQHRLIYEYYKKPICDLEESGLIKTSNKSVVTFAGLSLVNWCYRWFRDDGLTSIEEAAQFLIDIYLKGIGLPKKEQTKEAG